MKTSIIILFSLIGLISYTQTYDLNECPLHSNVWVSKYVIQNGITTTEIKPIGGGNFGLNTSYVKTNIDVDKINEYLLQSFNEFRKDYKVSIVTEDDVMSKECESFAKTLNGKLVHSKNRPSNQSECLGSVPFMLLSKVTEKDGDINKIIADCCFDIFIGCPGHTALLLDPKCKTYGFGVNITSSGIDVVVRGRL